MTAADLQAIHERAAATTPPPWTDLTNVFFDGAESYRVSQKAKDRAFIAHARTDIPALLAHIDRLQAVVDAGRHWVDAVEGNPDLIESDARRALYHTLKALMKLDEE